jgi:F0F1-type ATP synthase assembly protein I
MTLLVLSFPSLFPSRFAFGCVVSVPSVCHIVIAAIVLVLLVVGLCHPVGAIPLVVPWLICLVIWLLCTYLAQRIWSSTNVIHTGGR